MSNKNSPSLELLTARKSLSRKFKAKGLILGIFSGISCGLFSTFIIIGQAHGEWIDWYGDNTTGLSAFAIVFILGMLGSGINDFFGGLWTILTLIVKGKIGDLGRSLKSKPGIIVLLAALVGGVGAGGTYIIAMQLGGSAVVPFAAMCPVIGAILARILYKQDLSAHKIVGIIICVGATVMIGSSGLSGEINTGLIAGCGVALVTALCWAIEGVIVGYTCTLMDYEVGIAIRECATAIANLFIIIPILCMINSMVNDGQEGLYGTLMSGAFGHWDSLKYFIVGGFFVVYAYSLWYKGNNMCGAALGMAANAAYSFWTPFFCFTIAGLVFGQPGWEMPLINWIAAILMVVGILCIAVNPKELFKKEDTIPAVTDNA